MFWMLFLGENSLFVCCFLKIFFSQSQETGCCFSFFPGPGAHVGRSGGREYGLCWLEEDGRLPGRHRGGTGGAGRHSGGGPENHRPRAGAAQAREVFLLASYWDCQDVVDAWLQPFKSESEHIYLYNIVTVTYEKLMGPVIWLIFCVNPQDVDGGVSRCGIF